MRTLGRSAFGISTAMGVLTLLLPGEPAAGPRSVQRYAIEDLGTLSGYSRSVALALNASGQVVGYSATSDDRARRAFRWTQGVMQDLGTLNATFSHIEARGINASGQVVGYSYHPFLGACIGLPFLWTEGQGLRGLPGNSSCGMATDINNAGQVVGFLDAVPTPGPPQYAFLWRNGVVDDLGIRSTSQAYGLNNAGQVVGAVSTSQGEHAFRWTKGVILDLGTLGGATSTAYAINASGQVVGSSATASGQQHAFRWAQVDKGGKMGDLGTLGGASSIAFDIDASGRVVGASTTASGQQHAFVYTDATGMIDLNTRIDPALGWTLVEARGINDGGQIVGHGLHGGQVRAFRLTPRQ